MKKYEKVVIILILILVSTFLILNVSKMGLTGNTILKKYSYTKAICDSSGKCEDYLIECNGQKLKKLNPTGFVIQTNHKENTNENLCD